jgi:hypothetical protein
MNIFLRNLFLFILVFFALAGGIIAVSSVYMNNVPFKIDRKKNILIIGDSHTECAIDDSVFARAANYSFSSTSFLYSYAALRKLIADNPQIDTVLLSFQSSSLAYERERNWIFGEALMAKKIPVFLPYFNASDILLFIFQPRFYKSALETPRTTWDYFMNYRKNNKQVWINDNIGHFRELGYARLQEDINASKPFGSLNRRDTVSQVTLRYINKIASFCKEKHLALILINTPVYQWKTYVNFVEFDENREKFLKDYLFVDYADFPIADSCRADIWHLNTTGAAVFSKYLESNLARDINKQNQ